MKPSVVIAALLALAIGVVVAWSRYAPAPLPDGVLVDKVIVKKSAHTLSLYHGVELIRSYQVSIGRGSRGPKLREGDGRTPEGEYTLDFRNANSAFHRALHISYPNSNDAMAAKARGVSPGGSIMLHGMKSGLGYLGRLHTWIDWTDGCVAVTNREIEEIWRVVPDGTPITIEP